MNNKPSKDEAAVVQGGVGHQDDAASQETKTGIKTIDRLSELPVVSTALTNVTDYYEKVKEKNLLFRTSLNLAELSVKTMAFAATPITSLCKKPISSVDMYLCDKVDQLEHSYPLIAQPTDQLTATAISQAKDIYDRTVKSPIDTIDKKVTDIKNYGSNKVQAVVKAGSDSIDSLRNYGYDQLNKSADLGVRMVDACLENKLAKMFTEPVLNFTEKSLNYLIPTLVESDENKSNSIAHEYDTASNPTTLKRLYDINNRVYKHLYQTTFTQLSHVHFQFEMTIKRLQSLKTMSDMIYSDSRKKLGETLQNVSNNTLVAQCVQLIDKNKLSMNKMEGVAKSYYKAILTDANAMIDKYMALVKNFPIVFNGSKLKQTIENLMNQLNKNEQLSTYLTSTIENLKNIHQALLTYTNQMFQVFNDSKFAQILNVKQFSSNRLTANSSSGEKASN